MSTVLSKLCVCMCVCVCVCMCLRGPVHLFAIAGPPLVDGRSCDHDHECKDRLAVQPYLSLASTHVSDNDSRTRPLHKATDQVLPDMGDHWYREMEMSCYLSLSVERKKWKGSHLFCKKL